MFVCTYEMYAEKQNQIQIDPPYIPSIISPRFTAVTFSGVTSYRPTRSLTWTWFQQPKRWGGGHHQIRGLSSGKWRENGPENHPFWVETQRLIWKIEKTPTFGARFTRWFLRLITHPRIEFVLFLDWKWFSQTQAPWSALQWEISPQDFTIPSWDCRKTRTTRALRFVRNAQLCTLKKRLPGLVNIQKAIENGP